MAPKIGLEIPIFGPNAARSALALGASRIELNAAGSYPAGGLTPTLTDIGEVFAAILETSFPEEAPSSRPLPAPACLRVMIRPRGPPGGNGSGGAQDFIYTDAEFGQMLQSINLYRDTGMLDVERGDGFVFGILASSRVEGGGGAEILEVDNPRCRALVKACGPYKAVFHRAFDDIVGSSSSGQEGNNAEDEGATWKQALEDLAELGFDGVLTSGGPGTAIGNVERLGRVLDKAGSLGLEIIVGGGVRSKHLGELMEGLDARGRVEGVNTEDGEGRSGGQRILFHSSCLTPATARMGPDHIDGVEEQALLKLLHE